MIALYFLLEVLVWALLPKLSMRKPGFSALFAASLMGFSFLSQNPILPARMARHVSSCELDGKSLNSNSYNEFSHVFSAFMQNQNNQRSAESYSLFLQHMAFLSGMVSLNANSFMGFGVPIFPSYALPQISSYAVDLRKPSSNNQIFGGLMSNPQIQVLLSRTSSSPSFNSVAPTVMSGQETQQGFLSPNQRELQQPLQVIKL